MTAQDVETPIHKIRMSDEVMQAILDNLKSGGELSIDWGEPDDEGFQNPTVTKTDPVEE